MYSIANVSMLYVSLTERDIKISLWIFYPNKSRLKYFCCNSLQQVLVLPCFHLPAFFLSVLHIFICLPPFAVLFPFKQEEEEGIYGKYEPPLASNAYRHKDDG